MSKKDNHKTTPLFESVDFNKLGEIETITDEKVQRFTFDVVDFSDINRPKTCLEVDFPILKVNSLSAREATGPCTKPIYKMNKWWARRRSSVFRQMLISAATKAPVEETYTAQYSWREMYRKSHQKLNKFSGLSVLDPFMGGGTTVAEAARLGFQAKGVDLNPIAWWVVRNQVNPVSEAELRTALNEIEAEVKPQIKNFYSHESPWGFKATSTKNQESTNDIPEIIYTFWLKHIPCLDPQCFHLTPQIGTSIISEKQFKLKAYENCICPKCGDVFDIETVPHRMAPRVGILNGAEEAPYTVLDQTNGTVICPHCKKIIAAEVVAGILKRKIKPSTKTVTHYLCLPKQWMKGISGNSKDEFGGYFGATLEQDRNWFDSRKINFNLIEVRGKIPADLLSSNYVTTIKDSEGIAGDDTEKQSRKIRCGKCGRAQDPLESLRTSRRLAPLFPIAVHGFDPEAKKRKYGYNGRFFDVPNWDQFLECSEALRSNKELWSYIPTQKLFYSNQTHNWAVPDHGYTNWHYMFNPRQLLSNALLLKAIVESKTLSLDVKSQMLGAWQNFLRHNCMFTLWNIQADQLEPHFSNNNYRPKAMPIENSVFSPVGRGSFRACVEMVIDGMNFLASPYDLKVNDDESDGASKTEKVISLDRPLKENVTLLCQSSTDLRNVILDSSIDLVVTDPPFGDLVDYSELADFFLVWLYGPLSQLFKEVPFVPESPKTLEVVSNPLRHPGFDESNNKKKADSMYDRLLTLCWKECYRVLKPSGILTFTFHHSKDDAWVDILDSLFKSGFVLEATYPVRSDAIKGKGQFGARKVEFDIIHVCRKRLNDPSDIFWATLRKKILVSVKSHAATLAQHRVAGLHLADIEVIIRGEVLKEYSKHYGKVKKNLAGDLITVREILLEANSLALGLLQEQEEDRAPDSTEFQTKVFFSLMREGSTLERSAATKRLKGSGVSLDELVNNGWLKLENIGGQRFVHIANPLDRWNSISRKSELKNDLDQVHFAINSCVGGRNYKDKPADLETWIAENYKILLPSVAPILKYIESNHFGVDYKQAIEMAYRIIERTLNKIKESDKEFKKVSDQLSFFE